MAGGLARDQGSTRVAANASPEPFSNWALSLFEDVFVVGLGALALAFPVVAFGVAIGLLGVDRDVLDGDLRGLPTPARTARRAAPKAALSCRR